MNIHLIRQEKISKIKNLTFADIFFRISNVMMFFFKFCHSSHVFVSYQFYIHIVASISVPGGLVVMTLTQTVRDWGSIPHLGTEFFRIESLIRPNVTQQNAEIQRKLLLLSDTRFTEFFSNDDKIIMTKTSCIFVIIECSL